jgi:hypothetical protein
MSFPFRVGKVWCQQPPAIYHNIAVLEQGVIVPPVTAAVVEFPGESLQIDLQAIGGTLPGG